MQTFQTKSAAVDLTHLATCHLPHPTPPSQWVAILALIWNQTACIGIVFSLRGYRIHTHDPADHCTKLVRHRFVLPDALWYPSSCFKLTCDGTTTRLLSGIYCLEGMTYTPFGYEDTYRPELSDLWDRTPSYASTPGFLDRDCTPSVICPSPGPEERSFPLQPSQSNEPLPVVEKNGGAWDEQSSNCVHYQIEWKVTLNNRAVKKDTEQDLDLPPSCYWQKIKEEAANRLRRKITSDRRVKLDDTSVVVSVNDSSQRDLTKNFEGTSIDWTTVEKQLLAWSHLYHLGKQLLLQISINYIEDNSFRVDKRGKSSVTKSMLGVRDAEIDAEQASGQQSIWRDVYRIMRCPGPPCRHEGQYCWQDPDGKKHYKLRSNHLKSLIKHVQQGGVLETHDDIPDGLREQLYAEENQRLERQKKSSNNSASGSTCPPIHLHVLPAQSSQVSIPTGSELTNPASQQTELLDIPGLLDKAVEEYAIWHQLRVGSEPFRENIQKARDVALENCLDLKQIHEDQDPGFFVKHGVKAGAARRFVSDISDWVKRYRETNSHEEFS